MDPGFLFALIGSAADKSDKRRPTVRDHEKAPALHSLARNSGRNRKRRPRRPAPKSKSLHQADAAYTPIAALGPSGMTPTDCPWHRRTGREIMGASPERGAQGEDGEAAKRRRGPGVSKLSIDRTETLSVAAPAGSRHKGFEDIIVQDLMVKAETTRYRRERWETPDGKGLIAPLPAGIVGGCGPHLIRLVLMLHFQGQMTCERIVALLTGLGLMISKRQVVRLLTAKLEDFRAEDEAVLRAGLRSAPFVTVDDTGARHAGKSCFTTHIGSHRFTAFRTGPGKSRLAFLGRLLGGAARYVINPAAIATARRLSAADIIANLAGNRRSPSIRMNNG